MVVAQRLEPSLAHINTRGRSIALPIVIMKSSTPATSICPVTRNVTHRQGRRRRHHIHANIRAAGMLRLITMRIATRTMTIPELKNIVHHARDEPPMPPNRSRSRRHRGSDQVRQSLHPGLPTKTHAALAFLRDFRSRTGILLKNLYYFSEASLTPTHWASGFMTGLLPGMVRRHPCQRLQVTYGCC